MRGGRSMASKQTQKSQRRKRRKRKYSEVEDDGIGSDVMPSSSSEDERASKRRRRQQQQQQQQQQRCAESEEYVDLMDGDSQPQNIHEVKPRGRSGIGRRHLPLTYINDARKRARVFSNRSKTLLKNGIDLSILTNTSMLIAMITPTGEVSTISTGCMKDIFNREDFREILHEKANERVYMTCKEMEESIKEDIKKQEGLVKKSKKRRRRTTASSVAVAAAAAKE